MIYGDLRKTEKLYINGSFSPLSTALLNQKFSYEKAKCYILRVTIRKYWGTQDFRRGGVGGYQLPVGFQAVNPPLTVL